MYLCDVRVCPRLRSSFKTPYENTHPDQFLPMKKPRQTNNAYDPDIASFKILVRSCARSKTLMKRPLQTKIRYVTDFGSFNV